MPRNGRGPNGGRQRGYSPRSLVDEMLGKRVFRRWLRSRGWTAAMLAARLRVPLWRAEQLQAGRYAIRATELARLGDHAASYLATLRAELWDD